MGVWLCVLLLALGCARVCVAQAQDDADDSKLTNATVANVEPTTANVSEDDVDAEEMKMMLKLLLDSIEDYKTQLKDFEDEQKALEDKVQSLTEELDGYKNASPAPPSIPSSNIGTPGGGTNDNTTSSSISKDNGSPPPDLPTPSTTASPPNMDAVTDATSNPLNKNQSSSDLKDNNSTTEPPPATASPQQQDGQQPTNVSTTTGTEVPSSTPTDVIATASEDGQLPATSETPKADGEGEGGEGEGEGDGSSGGLGWTPLLIASLVLLALGVGLYVAYHNRYKIRSWILEDGKLSFGASTGSTGSTGKRRNGGRRYQRLPMSVHDTVTHMD